MKYFYNYLILTQLFLIACDTKHVDTKQLADQLADRKIRKITTSQILEFTLERGNQLFAKVDSADPKDPDYLAFKDSVLTSWQAEIVLALAKIEESNREDKIVNSLFDAYSYNVENNIESSPNAQLSDKKIVYSRPILNADSSLSTFNIIFDKRILIRDID